MNAISLLCGIVLAGAFQSANASPPNPSVSFDIAGVALGDTIEVAKAKIKKINPKLVFVDIPSRDRLAPSIMAQERASVGDWQSINDEFFITPSRDDKVAQISRYLKLKQDESYPRAHLVKALKDKYGTNPSESLDGSRQNWYFSPGEKPGFQHYCLGVGFSSGNDFPFVNGRPFSQNNRKVYKLTSTCLSAMEATNKVDDLGIVESYTITLADVKTLWNDANVEKADADTAKEKKKTEIEARSTASGGPKL